MNILIFNTHNPFNASGTVALDLFNQLKGRGHEVRLLVNSYDANYPEEVISMQTLLLSWMKAIQYKFRWRLDKLKKTIKLKIKNPRNYEYYFYQLNEQKQIYKTDELLKIAGNKPDIIFVLYADKFINIKNIYELYKKTGAKIFWLMFDMAPFTGGCHYAWECKGYQNNCGNCPALFSSDPFDFSYENLNYKKELLDKINIQILAGSEWQYLQAKNSTLFKNKEIHKILLSIDPSVFKPADKEKLRKEMKIPTDKKVIFFGAIGLTDRRKGMKYLIESLNKLKGNLKNTKSDFENNILLLVAGEDFDGIVNSLPFEFLYLGYLGNNYKLASAYQAADVFICPSIEDSGPMMINQSIMSGTPVVSFGMGVSLDLVITGETGYRAKLQDSDDMAQGIYSIVTMNDDNYKELSKNCRELAMKLISPEVRIEKIEDLLKNNQVH